MCTALMTSVSPVTKTVRLGFAATIALPGCEALLSPLPPPAFLEPDEEDAALAPAPLATEGPPPAFPLFDAMLQTICEKL